MSVNLYQTGVSGLLAAQQQLATTGHNISNVNTDGYTRQRAEQNASMGISNGTNYIGSGTYIQDITRIYNQFSYTEQLNSQSSLGYAKAAFEKLDQLNETMSLNGGAIQTSIEQFYQAVNGMADNPSDMGLRNIALSQAEVLASDFRSINQSFDQLEKATNGEIDQIARNISEISTQLAAINEQILTSQGGSQVGQANDLLDKRDQLITELGEYTKVQTVTDNNGVMTVMIGQGSTLVAGITPLSMTVVAGDPDPLQTQLRLAGPNSTVALQGSTLGGSLAAKFDFRDNDLMQVRAEVNRLAAGVAATLNDAQSNGLNLSQQQGENIFTDLNTTQMQQGRVLNSAKNNGDLQGRVNISDISLVPTDEFEVRFDGTNYQMTNLTDNSTVTLGMPGTGPFATAHGFEFIEDSGTPSTNDVFRIRPMENSAALMDVTLNDGAGFAASSPVAITPSDNNVSSGKVEITSMLDPEGARAAMPMRIDVLENPPGTFTYTYTDSSNVTSAPIPYVPTAQTIDLPPSPATALFQIEITGMPSGSATHAPEQFFIDDAYGLGNSTNMTAMALTQEQSVLNGSRETFSESLAISTSDIGSKASTAMLNSDTSQALYTQAYNRNQATSGVNLDEEAANLLKFQQAYQAASQIISTANTIFDTLLAAAR
ncbi:flagellar hook-associated protein FlgK [Thalassotalea sp. PLHSN55]|uniref:flagellar hook-associated protein FlgK n=1 Tax=Thalassotalea sp. PLHSN55 TaxID=3435888 RepID=UPI003F861384